MYVNKRLGHIKRERKILFVLFSKTLSTWSSVYQKLGNPAVIARCPKSTLTDPISLSQISNSASCISPFRSQFFTNFSFNTCHRLLWRISLTV